MNSHLKQAQLLVQKLSSAERTQLQQYIEALNSYTSTMDLPQDQLSSMTTAIQQELGQIWHFSTQPKYRKKLQTKLQQTKQLTQELKLTPVGVLRFWKLYIHELYTRLSYSETPLTPKLLVEWTTTPQQFLLTELPYPKSIQAHFLNGSTNQKK